MQTNIKFLLFIILILLCSCVSMKQFTSVSLLYSQIQKDSVEMQNDIIKKDADIADLIKLNISLGTDTLRLHKEHSLLSNKYTMDIQEGKDEIGRLSSRIYGIGERETFMKENEELRILKISSSINNTLSSSAWQLEESLLSYNRSHYDIENKNWELKILIRDTILYQPFEDGGFNYGKLSKTGKKIISQISKIIVEKDNFDLIVKEYVYINSPELIYLPPARIVVEQPTVRMIAIEDDTIYNDTSLESKIYEHFDPVERAKMEEIRIEKARQTKIMKERIRSYRLTQEKKNREIEQEETKKRIRHLRNMKVNDRTTVIMRHIVSHCYPKLGKNSISKDVTYIKFEQSTEEIGEGWIEIIMRPDIEILYDGLNELNNHKNRK